MLFLCLCVFLPHCDVLRSGWPQVFRHCVAATKDEPPILILQFPENDPGNPGLSKGFCYQNDWVSCGEWTSAAYCFFIRENIFARWPLLRMFRFIVAVCHCLFLPLSDISIQLHHPSLQLLRLLWPICHPLFFFLHSWVPSFCCRHICSYGLDLRLLCGYSSCGWCVWVRGLLVHGLARGRKHTWFGSHWEKQRFRRWRLLRFSTSVVDSPSCVSSWKVSDHL